MKIALTIGTAIGLAFSAWAADPVVGRLPNGRLYLKHEVYLVLKDAPARALSPADASRRLVAKGRLLALDTGIRDVIGGHTAAERWLKGEPLPERVRQKGQEVPKIARSLKALLHADQDAAQVVERLRVHPEVELADLNYLYKPMFIPNDARWTEQWGPPRVRADDAWDISVFSTSIRIAIVDTGVDLTHPDLASRIVYERGFAGNTNGDAKRDQRGGGSIDHGTHVAGIAAAIRNNSIGVAGIARANIMAMGCAVWTDSTNQYHIGSAPDAINDAVANGADVVNCSFSNQFLDPFMDAALDNAQDQEVLVIAAAGNEGTDVDSSPSQGWNDHPWPLIVSNVREDDTLNSGSNFGPAIDLAAPGTGILSTVTSNFQTPAPDGQYGGMTGTSMAAPCVAGGAAMVKGMNPGLMSIGSGIKHLLTRMAEDLGPAGKDNSFGHGMLQLGPGFLGALRDADAFLNPSADAGQADGGYGKPYRGLSDALAAEPSGSTLVLNGGEANHSTYHYPPVTISTPCLLTAFPDRPVVIGAVSP